MNLGKDIGSIGLSVRSVNALRGAGIDCVGHMMHQTEASLLEIKNMGRKSVDEILAMQARFLADGEEAQTYNLYIHSLFSETRNCSVDDIEIINDKAISKIGLSTRTTNSILRAGFTLISELVFQDYMSITRIKDMGAKSLEELSEYLKENLEYIIHSNECSERVEELFSIIQDKVCYDCSDFDFSFFERDIKNNIKKYIDSVSEISFEYSDDLLLAVINQDNIMDDITKYISELFMDKDIVLTIRDIKGYFPMSLLKGRVIENAISKLIKDNRIEVCEEGYRERITYLDEWIESISDTHRDIISQRLDGKTLEECGKSHDVTRERARQIIDKQLKKRPTLREDDYAYWYTKYDLSEESFRAIFGTDIRTYYYLSLAYNRGTKEVEEIASDEKCTAIIFEKVDSYVYRDCIEIDGEYVPISKTNIERKLAQKYCANKSITVNEFFNIYNDFICSNGLNANEKLIYPSARAFEARVLERPFILSKYGKKIRYYPSDQYDVVELVKQLHLEQIIDVEISTLKLFREYSDVMTDFNIEDEYELHNILRRSEKKWNEENQYKIRFSRMPFMLFGNANREEQTIKLLFQVAPVSVENLANLYEAEYGVMPQTFMANMIPFISKYYHNGMCEVNQPLFSAEENEFMSSLLVEDFYFVDDIKNAYIERFGKNNIDRVNARTLKELGYRVYAGYLIRNSFVSAEDYFTRLFTSNNIIDLNNFDGRLIYVQSSNQALDNLRSGYDLLEYEDRKYIMFTYMHSVLPDISKKGLCDYVEQTMDYAQNERFYTIKYLKRQGYDHPMHHVGFEDWFNAALLKNSKKIKFVRVGNNILFSNAGNAFTTIDFLSCLLDDVRGIDIIKFADLLNDEYGIELAKDKIIQMIKETDLYYNPIMEKIYRNKQEFYKDI